MSLFITIEGIEGAGKSSLISALQVELESLGQRVLRTREPGATALGAELRALLLNRNDLNISPLAELMVFFADRAQHVEEIIKPALRRSELVLCDRYMHSTFSYQGYARGLDLEMLKAINSFVTQQLEADIVLLLDLPPEIGLQRAKGRIAATQSESEWNRFEEEQLEFHRQVRQGFLTQAKAEPGRFIILDATKPLAEVQREALSFIHNFIHKKSGAN